MGYPLTSYRAFKELSDKNSKMHNRYKKLTERFTLFALIVHDPIKNLDFDRYINQNFERLDRITGDNFLFFTLVRPSDRWLERTSNRNHHQYLSETQFSQDMQLDVYGFCKYLNIDYSELPVIILGNSLTFNGFFSVKTNHRIFGEQMEEISQFCDEVCGFFNMFTDGRFHHLINRIKKIEQALFINRTKSIADGVIDLLSIYNESRASSSLSQKIKQEIGDIRSFQKTLSNEDGNYEELLEVGNQRIEDLLLFLATRFSSIAQNQDQFFTLDNGYENESHILLKTFNSINYIINSNGTIDTSIGIIPLTKIFEIETNLSFVQYIREILYIDMPTYFNKPYKSKERFYFSPNEKLVGNNPKPIDFNQQKNGKYVPPAIGQSRLAVETLFLEKNLPDYFDHQNFNNFLRKWTRLAEIRNQAAHTGHLGKNDFAEVCDIFAWIKNNGFDKSMIELKEDLRNNSFR